MVRQTNIGNIDGAAVILLEISNSDGDTVSVMNYGGTITSWTGKDKNGVRRNITIGFDRLEKYLPNNPNFGVLVGRFANRIAKGRFTIDGHTYQLGLNEGNNQLHGGENNFTKVIWHAVIDDENSITLSHMSADGNEGYPGTVAVRVHFSLNDDNELTIQYQATTDKTTHINLTSHPYFNLSGDFSKDILDHELVIFAKHYLPVDKEGIPTGEIAAVKDTAYDFTQSKKIGKDREQVNGYDNNFVLNHNSKDVALAAKLTDPISGRTLEVYTDQPGLQLYTANGLDGSYVADDGTPVRQYAGVCLETQHFPDTPNHPEFPSTLLRPGEIFASTTKYKLSVGK